MNGKALVLLSGGLDSMLAAKVLLEQGVEVVGVTFISNFFGASRGLEAAKQLGVPLIAYNISPQHLEMVKHPKYGYGKNMNPCIDCHSMMLAKAKEIMEGEEVVLVYPDSSIKAMAQKYDFIATGEVLGQRPMSQNKSALGIVAKYSGVGDKLVRPLSGKLLNLTDPEKQGKIKRENLLDISGRSRKRQVELAAHYGLKDYPSPAGGCLLTVPEFGVRLKELFDKLPACTGQETELLKYGRIFWFDNEGRNVMIVVGRDQKDCEALEKLKKKADYLINFIEEMGPTTLVHIMNQQTEIKSKELEVEIPEELDLQQLEENSKSIEEILHAAALLTGYFATKLRGKKVKLKIE